MRYQKTEWTVNDVITENKLNNIEKAVKNMILVQPTAPSTEETRNYAIWVDNNENTKKTVDIPTMEDYNQLKNIVNNIDTVDVEEIERLKTKINNLAGKTAVWDGDSICAAGEDKPEGGWPGRIATANDMQYYNCAVSGATITSNTTAKHWISTSIDTIAQMYSDADYIIIEGGTNDADALAKIAEYQSDGGLGEFDPNDFSEEYIANLNKNKFSGALEYVFYKLVTVWKGKHIGYIIPHKMGVNEVSVQRRIRFFNRAKEIATKWGIPVLDLWNNYYFNWRLPAHYNNNATISREEINLSEYLYIDGQHLTKKGYATEAPIIAEWMKSI